MNGNQQMRRSSLGARQWANDARGSAGVECALIIACVALLAIIAVRCSDDAISSAFYRTADGCGARSLAELAPDVHRAATPGPTERAPSWQGWNWRYVLPSLVLPIVAGMLLSRRTRASIQPTNRIQAFGHWLQRFQWMTNLLGRRKLPSNRPRARSQARFIAKRQDILHTLSIELTRVLPGDLEVWHLMTAEVATAQPVALASELAEQMRRQDIRHVLICDRDGQLLGLVSDRDRHAIAGWTAGDIMTRDMITVEPDTLVRTAITIMLERHVSSLPVVKKGKLVGILTTTDMMMALQCAMQVVEPVVRDVLTRTVHRQNGAAHEALVDPSCATGACVDSERANVGKCAIQS